MPFHSDEFMYFNQLVEGSRAGVLRHSGVHDYGQHNGGIELGEM